MGLRVGRLPIPILTRVNKDRDRGGRKISQGFLVPPDLVGAVEGGVILANQKINNSNTV